MSGSGNFNDGNGPTPPGYIGPGSGGFVGGSGEAAPTPPTGRPLPSLRNGGSWPPALPEGGWPQREERSPHDTLLEPAPAAWSVPLQPIPANFPFGTIFAKALFCVSAPLSSQGGAWLVVGWDGLLCTFRQLVIGPGAEAEYVAGGLDLAETWLTKNYYYDWQWTRDNPRMPWKLNSVASTGPFEILRLQNDTADAIALIQASA